MAIDMPSLWLANQYDGKPEACATFHPTRYVADQIETVDPVMHLKNLNTEARRTQRFTEEYFENHSSYSVALPASGYVPCGDWFSCKKNEVIDLDILIGECPGGRSGAWLCYENQREEYKTVDDKLGKQPVLPAFQLASHQFERDHRLHLWICMVAGLCDL